METPKSSLKDPSSDQVRQIPSSSDFLLVLFVTAIEWLVYVQRQFWMGALILLVTFGFAQFRRHPYARALLVLFVFHLSAAFLSLVPFMLWPVDFFLVGGIVWLALSRTIGGKATDRWGWRWTKAEWFSIIGISVPSLFALLSYYYFYPGVAKQWPLPPMPPAAIPIAIISIAAINGLREEFVYRFILQRFLANSVLPTVAILIQASAFGFLHFTKGFPSGYVGVSLTFLFGIALGIQYYWFQSRTLTWITHSFVDLIMFTVILMSR